MYVTQCLKCFLQCYNKRLLQNDPRFTGICVKYVNMERDDHELAFIPGKSLYTMYLCYSEAVLTMTTVVNVMYCVIDSK